jgi:hypothetical protein
MTKECFPCTELIFPTKKIVKGVVAYESTMEVYDNLRVRSDSHVRFRQAGVLPLTPGDRTPGN